MNGEVVREPGLPVEPDRDRIEVNGRPLPPPGSPAYFVLHKPVGVISTLSDPEGRRTLRDYLPPGARVFPVGRLDADTSGLLILTNDGELAHHLMHPRYGVTKLYRVHADRAPSAEMLRRLQDGIEFEPGVRSAPARVRVRDEAPGASVIELELHEGRYRQVRRMCEAAGLRVLRLHRWGYGPLRLAGLDRGLWRELSEAEVRRLRAASSRPQPRPPGLGPAVRGRGRAQGALAQGSRAPVQRAEWRGRAESPTGGRRTSSERPPDFRGPGSRGADSRGLGSRAPASRTPYSRAPGSRGPDSRGPDSRAPGARGPGSRAPDSRAPNGRPPRSRDYARPDSRSPDRRTPSPRYGDRRTPFPREGGPRSPSRPPGSRATGFRSPRPRAEGQRATPRGPRSTSRPPGSRADGFRAPRRRAEGQRATPRSPRSPFTRSGSRATGFRSPRPGAGGQRANPRGPRPRPSGPQSGRTRRPAGPGQPARPSGGPRRRRGGR